MFTKISFSKPSLSRLSSIAFLVVGTIFMFFAPAITTILLLRVRNGYFGSLQAPKSYNYFTLITMFAMGLISAAGFLIVRSRRFNKF